MIGRKSFLIIVSRILSAGLAYIALYFITRYLGAEVYGLVTWTMAFVATFNIVSDLGFNRAHVKRVSEGQDLDECVSTFAVSKLFLTGMMVVTVLVSVWIWTTFLGGEMEKNAMQLIVLFILFYVFQDVAQIATMTFDAYLMTAKTQLSMLMDPLIRVPLVIFVSINRMQAVELAFAYVLGVLAFMIAALFLLLRQRIKWSRPKLMRSYLKFAMPVATIVIMGALVGNLDKLLLGVFWSNTEVGYYAASQSIISLIAVLGTAASTLIFPTFSRMHSNGEMEAVSRTITEAERYLIMMALPAVTLIFLFPTEVSVVLLGGGFADSAGPMRYLALSMLFSLLCGVYVAQIDAFERPGLRAKLTFVSLLVNLLLLLVLVPATLMGIQMLGLGGTGAALAQVAFYGTLLLSSRYVVYRLTGTGVRPRLLLHLLAAGGAAGAMLLLSTVLPITRWYWLLVHAGVALASFGAILYAVGELKREDIDYFLSSINPWEMRNYMRDELTSKKK